MNEKLGCLFPGCGKLSKTRGLCDKHINAAKQAVRDGATTWDQLEREGRCSRLKTTPYRNVIDRAAKGIVILIAALTGCRENEIQRPVTIETDFRFPLVAIRTIEHDGHKLIVATTGSSGVAIILHPDDRKASE